MKSFLLYVFFGFFIVNLSMGTLKSVGLASDHAFSLFNIPYELAMGVIVISLPLGIFTMAKFGLTCLSWFARTWKLNGNK